MQDKVVTAPYSVREELAHSVTHGIGTLLSAAGLLMLVRYSVRHGDGWHIATSCIYGISLVGLFTSSTLYHSVTIPRLKHVLRRLDHAAIFVLIAGTYTPFALVIVGGGWGWALFGAVWAIAIAGIAMELGMKKRFENVSVALYLGLGWLGIIAIEPLAANLAPGGLMLLLSGGVLYSVGVIFYVWKTLLYHHAIWHLFVLAGSAAHFFAILLFVIPDRAVL
jgi:hemolysin III